MYTSEEWNCPLCDGSEYQVALQFRNSCHKAVKCSYCGMLRLQPRVVESDLPEIYDENYCGSPSEFSYGGRSYTSRIARWKQVRTVEKIHRWRLRTIEKHAPYREVLEIGSGDGGFLAFLKDRGWECLGVELSEEAAQRARGRGLEILTGDLTKLLLPANTYPLAAMYHVLEHVYNLRRFVAELHRVLRPGGIAVIEVPNFGSFSARIFRSNWMGWHVPYHINLFSTETIKRCFLESGFTLREISQWSPSAGPFWKISSKTTVRALFGDGRMPGRRVESVPSLCAGPVRRKTVFIDILADPVFALMGSFESILQLGSAITVVAQKSKQQPTIKPAEYCCA